MRRFSVPGLFLVLASLVLVAITPGCGGGGETGPTVPTKVTLAPSTLSLGHGLFSGSSTSVLGANDQPLGGFTVTFTSTNPSIVTVSPSGEVCGGVWNENHTVCAPAAAGTAEVTATAGGVTSAPMKVFVHERIDSITLSPTSAACHSQEESTEYTATVFGGGADITSTVGPVAWTLVNDKVGELKTDDLPGNKVKVVAKQPGRSTLFARLGNVNSLAATFQTCSPASIAIRAKDGVDTSFELAVSGTQALEAEVLDTKGNPLTDLALLWHSTQPPVAASSATGMVTAQGPGTTRIVASCSPPDCIQGVNESHYSNPVTITVPGTSDTTVYVAGTGTKSMIPIPTTTNVPGTAVTLQHEPNSFLFLRSGFRGYIGSDQGLMVLLATGNNTFVQPQAKGRVLATSTRLALVSETAAGRVHLVLDDADTTPLTMNLAGVTHAAISLDETKIFMLSGSTLYVWTPTPSLLRTLALPAAGGATAFMANSSLAYISGGAPQNIMVRSGCDSEFIHGLNSPAPPAVIAAIPDNSGMVSAEGASGVIQHIQVQVGGATCAPDVVDTITSHNFGIGSFTPRDLFVTADGKHAFVVADQDRVLAYDIAAGTTSTIALSGGAAEAFTGGATLDGKQVYVGATGAGDAHAVHRIDVATGAEAQRIPVNFVPNLVRVRPR